MMISHVKGHFAKVTGTLTLDETTWPIPGSRPLSTQPPWNTATPSAMRT